MVFGSGSRTKLAPTLGYKTGFEEQYEVQHQLGKGGNGAVRLARHKSSGEAHREGRHSLPLPPAAAACRRHRPTYTSYPTCTLQAAALR
jgi:hypothetical protein